MQTRVEYEQLYKAQPVLARSLIALNTAARESGLELSLIHLVKLRVSQINGCAFCQCMHANEARRDGERQSRLDVLAGWREAPGFSVRERAALAWAEALTLLAHREISDAIYAEASDQFTLQELANLTTVTIEINGWNRIAVAFRFLPDLG